MDAKGFERQCGRATYASLRALAVKLADGGPGYGSEDQRRQALEIVRRELDRRAGSAPWGWTPDYDALAAK